jgi:hypothetical protein
MSGLQLACLGGAMLVSAVCWAQDAPEAAMMAPSYFDAQRSAQQQQMPLLQVSKQQFQAAYRRAGSPQMVFLLGERFDDLVSDWYSNHRVNITASAAGTVGTPVPEYQQVTVANEQKISTVRSRSSLLSARQWQAYERGFNNELLAYGVRPVNRNVALRLVDSQLRAANQRQGQADQQRLEMDMLRQQGKVLFEIVPYEDSYYQYPYLGYHIAMTSLADATLLADEQISLPRGELVYRASDSGYALQAPEDFAAIVPGRSGYDIIENVTDVWAEQGRWMAQASLQLIYTRVLN